VIDGQPLACFQPFIDTATGRIAGVEALGRLRQTDGRLASVGPLFADPRTPAIALRRLDRQIRDNALSRLHEAPNDWFLGLNMSPRWINRLRAGQALPSLKQLSRHDVDPRRIVFEITELGGDIQRLADVVTRYRQAGARIAIDDFGAGYSQLDRVLALQPDILKLDMRLFQAAALGGPSSDVVKALAQMAEKTGCWIIAEGVETEAQLNFALECGSRYVQGYLFAGAQTDFFATDAFVERFAQLRQRYVQQKLAERGRLMLMRQHLCELMAILQTWAQAIDAEHGVAQPTLGSGRSLPGAQLVMAPVLLSTAGRRLGGAPADAFQHLPRRHQQSVLPHGRTVFQQRRAPAAHRYRCGRPLVPLAGTGAKREARRSVT